MPPKIAFDWNAQAKPNPIAYGFGPSPFGSAIVLIDAVGLCGLGFGDDETALAGEMRVGCDVRRDDARAQAVLKTIFATGGPLRVHIAGTDWQIAVWRALCDIPYGTTTNYGALAEALSHPRGARAVGAAVGANPVAWLIPCHRVVGMDGALTGYRWGLEVKRAMLAAEAQSLSPSTSAMP
jgi:AraC family transcriptional regulator, regulatory protein of adaptative response / methylated-DNA-[protein]-cysteine methyltransferase